MPDTGVLLKYLHILAAMVYVTGYISGSMLQAAAGRATEWPTRRLLMRWANLLTTRLLIPGFIVAGALGIATALALGYPLTRGWVSYALIVYAIMFVTGVFYWNPLGRKQQKAIDASDEGSFKRLATSSSIQVVLALDTILLLLLIYLMVVRPA